MPTSAARPPAPRGPTSGLTLVETLVALSILAVTAGALMLSLGGIGRGAAGEQEANRLAARLQLAADLALVTGAPLALRWDPGGYQFLAWDPDGGDWRPSGAGDLGDRRALPAALRLAREDSEDARPLRIEADRPRSAVLRIDAGSVFGLDGGSAVFGRDGGKAAWRIDFDGIGATVRTDGGHAP